MTSRKWGILVISMRVSPCYECAGTRRAGGREEGCVFFFFFFCEPASPALSPLATFRRPGLSLSPTLRLLLAPFPSSSHS